MGDLQIVPAANKNGYFSTELVEMEFEDKEREGSVLSR